MFWEGQIEDYDRAFLRSVAGQGPVLIVRAMPGRDCSHSNTLFVQEGARGG